jgi:hypothetical protein
MLDNARAVYIACGIPLCLLFVDFALEDLRSDSRTLLNYKVTVPRTTLL